MAVRRTVRVLAVILAAALGAASWYLATLYGGGEAHRGTLALVGATVLAGEDLQPLARATVLVRDGRIAGVGGSADVAIPPDASRVDLSGLTLMPGLVDTHVHLGGAGTLDALRFAPTARRALLRHGVTTVRCLGNDLDWVLELRGLLARGELEGPQLLAAGPLFTTPGGHPVTTLFGGRREEAAGSVRLPADAAEAREAVRALAESGAAVDVIKVVQERGGPNQGLVPIEPSVLGAVVAEAHAHGLPVTAHWGTAADLEEVLAAGVDGLEHVGRVLEGWPDGRLRTLAERRVSLAPTLAVMETRLEETVMRTIRARVAEAHAAGVPIVAGSDAGMRAVPYGASLHREIELLAGSGLGARGALKAATSEAARVLRRSDLGVVAVGRAADLLAVRGDPLQDVAAIRDVVLVYRDGRLVVDGRSGGFGR
jgi:enamidase